MQSSKDDLLRSLKESDCITQDEINHAPGGYRLYVDGVGNVVVKAVRTPGLYGGKCVVHRPSLIRLVQTTKPDADGKRTFEIDRIEIDPPLNGDDPIDHICIGEGKGCDILVLEDDADE